MQGKARLRRLYRIIYSKDHHFGLHSAGRGRLARHGRPRQGSMYL